MKLATNDRPGLGEDLARELRAVIERAVARNGGRTDAIDPGRRTKFHWPPHPISYSFHVLTSDWSGRDNFEAHGETFDVRVATTPFGVFGRCDAIWHEERGDTREEMLVRLRESAEPLFRRQFRIQAALEGEGRFQGHLRDLEPIDLFKLLYCEDRDVANDARTEIEAHHDRREMFPALLEVLRDRRHPHRRAAQWCVLDLFEDLPSFTRGEEEEAAAVQAIKGLIWSAEDDFARTAYKAGVVLGGHIPDHHGEPTLIECLRAPSRIGRRSAIHGLFHAVEWMPETRDVVVAALCEAAARERDPQLREYAQFMAEDIAAGTDHRPEPIFDSER